MPTSFSRQDFLSAKTQVGMKGMNLNETKMSNSYLKLLDQKGLIRFNCFVFNTSSRRNSFILNNFSNNSFTEGAMMMMMMMMMMMTLMMKAIAGPIVDT